MGGGCVRNINGLCLHHHCGSGGREGWRFDPRLFQSTCGPATEPSPESCAIGPSVFTCLLLFLRLPDLTADQNGVNGMYCKVVKRHYISAVCLPFTFTISYLHPSCESGGK